MNYAYDYAYYSHDYAYYDHIMPSMPIMPITPVMHIIKHIMHIKYYDFYVIVPGFNVSPSDALPEIDPPTRLPVEVIIIA